MATDETTGLTELLHRVGRGDQEATEQLISIVYPELRRMAAHRLRLERANHTFQPTDLVNELYLRLFGSGPVNWQNRAHFFAVAARQMRFALIDHARNKKRGEILTITLDGHEEAEALKLATQTREDVLAIDEALEKLEEIDPRAAKGVELRFFGGLTVREVAEVQQIDVSTVKRDWVFARSWIFHQLGSPS